MATIELVPSPPPIRVLEIIESANPPAVPPGWSFTPLPTPGRWVTWNDEVVAVVIVFGVTPSELLGALLQTGYRPVEASDTYELWAAQRS